MTNYVISYEFAALVIILMFAAFYFPRKKYHNVQNNLFTTLLLIIIGCIVFDLASVFVLDNPDLFSNFVMYLTNIIYFMLSGTMAVVLSVYFLKQTHNDYIIKKSIVYKIAFSIPYLVFAFTTLSTPWLKLLFYIDEDRVYQQGVLCYVLLLIVVMYLVFSFVCLTINRDKITLRKRIPYYIYMSFLAIAIILQYLFPRYLLYGFAEAVSTVVVYLSNHNPSDLTDETTELYNRRALFSRLRDIRKEAKSYRIIGFTIKDFVTIYDNKIVEDGDFLLTLVGRFIKLQFGQLNSFYLGSYTYAIIVPAEGDEANNAIKLLQNRFMAPWIIKGENNMLEIGMCSLTFPDDIPQAAKFMDELENGVLYSLAHDNRVIEIEDIRTEQDTKIKKLEAENIIIENLRQKAENSDKSKSLFLAQMSHEIRTPMTAILGMTELVLRDSDSDKVREHANAILNSGRSLISIINDILDFSKIEAGKLQIVNDNYCITSTINDVIAGVEQRLADKHLNFSVNLDPSIPSLLFGDEIRVKQIITNILTNACKYTDTGCITFNINWTRKDSTCTLCIEVKDTGIGIKKENIDKLFDGFERFDNIKNKYIEGTGLGLAICKQLVTAMNGQIEVESEYGQGSTFRIYLPQQIISDEPSMSFGNVEDYNILAYAQSDHEEKNYTNTFEQAGISYNIVRDYNNIDRLLENRSYTHIFVPLNEYNRRLNSNDPLVNDNRLVICLYYRQYTADIGNHKSMHMPIYSMSLASILSEESIVGQTTLMTQVPKYQAREAKLLVVDDNIVNLQIVNGLLECHHMRVDTADSGAKALQMTRSTKYHIIFLDHMMPGKDGIETLHELRNDSTNLNLETPVIAFTANAISGMKEFFFEQGFNDFLSKPIDITKMEEIILNLLPPNLVDFTAGEDKPSSKESDEFTVPGLDMGQALFYAGGSYKMLKSILEVFYRDGSKKIDIIKNYVSTRDIENFRIEIHAVKSLCKGVGAGAISEQALQLETAAKEKNIEYILTNYEECLNNYEKLLADVKVIIAKPQEEDKAKKTKESLLSGEELLTCISALCDAFESELASKLTEELASSEDPAMAEHGQKIKEFLDAFNYDGAKEYIESI